MDKIGIDLGGTKTEGILLDEELQVIERKRVSTNQSNGYGSILDTIKDLVNELKQKSEDDTSIGVCTPGALSKKSGLIKNSNTQCLIGKDLKSDLEKILNQEISIENDANCFALAEATIGAAKKYNVVFGVILGTGCGAGIIMNKKIHRGPNAIAGEWGHHTLYPDGRPCYCGNQGCTESYISGTALESEWKELTGEFATVTDVIDNKMYKAHPEWKENFMMNFGRALSNVIDILDPDAIVMGGGLSKVDLLYTEGMQAVYKESFSEVVRTPIIKNKLGDSGGVFGAAMIMDHI